MIKDYASATGSHKRALDIRQKVLGEGHAKTADSYHKLGLTQYLLKGYTSATESNKRALNIGQRYWVKIMRAPLQATLTLGLPSICLEITPQLLSLKTER